MKKILYFEGAGWPEADISKATVGNCVIRTAFHNSEGKAIYLAVVGCAVSKHHSDSVKLHAPYAGFVDSCHYVTGGNNDENEHSLSKRGNVVFDYTHDGILKFVNSLGCSFDSIVVLPKLAGYRVFKNSNSYNYGDEFRYNGELTLRAETIHQHFYELEKAEGKKYPNVSLWVDENNPELLHLLRHFNGYNKHWSICNVVNWLETIVETPLGKYGC